MDLPLEPIPIPRAQRERIAKAVKQRVQEGREEHEKNVLFMLLLREDLSCDFIDKGHVEIAKHQLSRLFLVNHVRLGDGAKIWFRRKHVEELVVEYRLETTTRVLV